MEATANVLAACEAAQEKRELVCINSHRGRWFHSLAKGLLSLLVYELHSPVCSAGDLDEAGNARPAFFMSIFDSASAAL